MRTITRMAGLSVGIALLLGLATSIVLVARGERAAAPIFDALGVVGLLTVALGGVVALSGFSSRDFRVQYGMTVSHVSAHERGMMAMRDAAAAGRWAWLLVAAGGILVAASLVAWRLRA